jgi:integrase
MVVAAGRITVEVYVERWLARHADQVRRGRSIRPATLEFYKTVLRAYCLPHVGSRPLPKLTVADVETMTDALHDAGLAVRTQRAARQALGRVLDAARRDGLVAGNVVRDASELRAESTDPSVQAIEPDRLARLLDAARDTRWEPILAVSTLLGLRRGEVLALSWDDLDLDPDTEPPTLTVRRGLTRQRSPRSQLVLHEPKTRNSKRVLGLPAVLVEILGRWRIEQAREALAAGPSWGAPHWRDETLIFTTPTGEPVSPDTWARALSQLGAAAGIGHVRSHQLRHSAASMMIEAGLPVSAVSETLGHANSAITLTVYAHAFERAKVVATSAVAERLGLQVAR